ncbi:50S ribosomal protein L4 [Candidatus Microgenomates bacterium]|nr:50S ribosomal protein L4 [Candidatus Microgenomates bacterium]
MAVKVNVFDIKGEITGKISLPDEIFAVEAKKELIAQAVRVYLANQRQGTASTKNRSEVRGSRRKIWRQKGTGRARHGDKYAPIFVGGGIAHGPKPKDFSLKFSKKMRKKALFGTLTLKLKEKQLLVVSGLEKIKPKTKELVKVIKALKLEDKNNKLKTKTLLVAPKKTDNLILAGRNLENLVFNQADLLNAYTILSCQKLILMKEAIPVLKETFLKK